MLRKNTNSSLQCSSEPSHRETQNLTSLLPFYSHLLIRTGSQEITKIALLKTCILVFLYIPTPKSRCTSLVKQARQLADSFYCLYFPHKQQSFTGMKDRCTSEPKLLSAAAQKLWKDQKSWDSFVLARTCYCATTALGKPFWHEQKETPQQGCESGHFRRVNVSYLPPAPETQRLFSDAVVKWGPEGAGVSSESFLFTIADTDSVWREADEAIWIKPGGKAIGSATWQCWEQEQPPASSQTLSRTQGGFFVCFFIASMDGTRLTNGDSEVDTGT